MQTAGTNREQRGARRRATRLKVTQIKSKISEKPNQRESLRSLGLKRIGDAVLRPNDAQTRGYVRTVAHLVRVEELDPVEGNLNDYHVQQLPSDVIHTDVQGSEGDHEMSELEQRLSSEADGVQIFDQGEFIEWHKRDDLRSMVWSSNLSVATLLKRMQDVLGEPGEGRRGLVRRHGESRVIIVTDDASDPHVSAREAVEIATKSDQDVEFLWLDFGHGRTLAWTPSTDTERPTEQKNPSEASLSFSPRDRDLVERAIRSTATEHIGELAAQLVERVTA